MPACKITVLKRAFNQDLAEQYCLRETSPCTRFSEGQEFIVPYGEQPPAEFCDWAWNDIYNAYLTLVKGGSNFTPWMKDGNSVIRCCNDGIRPVVFMIERVED